MAVSFAAFFCLLFFYKIFHLHICAGIFPFNKENLALRTLITDAAIAEHIDLGERRIVNTLNGKEATLPEILNTLAPHYTLGIYHGDARNLIPLDFKFLNAGDVDFQWRSGNANEGKVFSRCPAIIVQGVNVMNSFQ